MLHLQVCMVAVNVSLYLLLYSRQEEIFFFLFYELAFLANVHWISRNAAHVITLD